MIASTSHKLEPPRNPGRFKFGLPQFPQIVVFKQLTQVFLALTGKFQVQNLELAQPSRRTALVICSIPAVYFLIYLLFAVVHYRDYALGIPQFLRYVVAPIVLIAVFVFCMFRLSPAKALRVGSIGTAMLAGMFLFELQFTARLLFVLSGMQGSTSEDTTPFRDGLPPGYGLKNINIALGVKALPDALLSGPPRTNTLLCTHDGKQVTYISDRYGFNNPGSAYSAEIEIMVLGDSFVEGMCLDTEKSFVGALRSMHPNTIGIGLRGVGPLVELAMLGRYGPALKPQNVVMAFFEGNDWENLASERERDWLLSALSPGASFGASDLSNATAIRTKEIVRSLWQQKHSTFDVLWRTQFLRNFLALHHTMAQIGLSYPKVIRDSPDYLAILNRAKGLVSSWNGTLTLLYIPQDDRYVGLLNRDFTYNQLRDRVLQAAKSADLDVIDLSESFAHLPNPQQLYAPDSHFSERGALEAARSVSAEMRK